MYETTFEHKFEIGQEVMFAEGNNLVRGEVRGIKFHKASSASSLRRQGKTEEPAYLVKKVKSSGSNEFEREEGNLIPYDMHKVSYEDGT